LLAQIAVELHSDPGKSTPCCPGISLSSFRSSCALWDDETFTGSANTKLKGRVGSIVGAYARELPFDLTSMNILRYWKGALASIAPREADQVAAELTRRTLLARCRDHDLDGKIRRCR
jgi:hypothetical protein